VDFNKIKIELSKKHDEIKVVNFLNYLMKLETEKYTNGEKRGQEKNTWFRYKTEKDFIDMFNKLACDKLYIDGDIASIQSTGISLSYNAYKNLVLNKYPETKFDIQLVRETDDFNFQKKDGKVFYTHKLNNPFEDKPILGAYCIIKNKLGDFIEIISLKELEKIRKTAKTDYIWATWTSEMYLKTVIKRACKRHFKDITIKTDNIDNENYDVENPIDIDIKIKQDIEAITTIEELSLYYKSNIQNNDNPKSFNKLICMRKEELKNANI